MFGVCTSLGLGVLQLNAGLHRMNSDIDESTTVQVIIIWSITACEFSNIPKLIKGRYIQILRQILFWRISKFTWSYIPEKGTRSTNTQTIENLSILNLWGTNDTPKHSTFKSIQVFLYNSLGVARQNVPITSILANYTLGSWKDFDVNLSLIGSKDMIWKTFYVLDIHVITWVFKSNFDYYFQWQLYPW